MKPETEAEFLDRRIAEMSKAAKEAIRREVAWLREHNFPIWIAENGRVFDAREKSKDTSES